MGWEHRLLLHGQLEALGPEVSSCRRALKRAVISHEMAGSPATGEQETGDLGYGKTWRLRGQLLESRLQAHRKECVMALSSPHQP